MPESDKIHKKGTLSTSDLDDVKKRYQNRIEQFGVSFDSLNSGDQAKQIARCEAHLKSMDINKSHVLDIGCGLGSFYNFLKQNHAKYTYTGYDIVNEYINYCKEHYKDASFECRNIFEDGIEGTYDTIVMSQVLNNRYSSSDNMEVMCNAIELAFKHTTHSVSIDMMSKYVDFENPELYYYQPEEVFKYAKKVTKKVRLLHEYRPFEFCIQLFH
jgi:2-polyprenyl-3-methyl-5-hydroxy-6-metoxy-1,4-benzoquinol methylase